MTNTTPVTVRIVEMTTTTLGIVVMKVKQASKLSFEAVKHHSAKR